MAAKTTDTLQNTAQTQNPHVEKKNPTLFTRAADTIKNSSPVKAIHAFFARLAGASPEKMEAIARENHKHFENETHGL